MATANDPKVVQTEAAAQLLAQVAEAGGRLLRVARQPLPGPGGAEASARLRLIFDVGAVELANVEGALLAEPAEAAEPGAGWVVADEEEPWWAVLGNPPSKAHARDDGALLLQFREDHESPRIFLLLAQGAALRVQSLV